MDNLQKLSFEMLSSVGEAKSCFIESMAKARINDFESANTLYEEGEMQNYILNENVIFKCWTDEVMLDFGGEKVFFYRDDFKEIMIEWRTVNIKDCI